ncbi:hypothetical protein GF374_02045 [Candidatus Woesearchaeota archaeon]|nr:hypothetical protein [Candidatus Woesearchaeota archaeon]
MNKSKETEEVDYNGFEDLLRIFTKFIYKGGSANNAPPEIEKFYCVEKIVDLIKAHYDSEIIKFSGRNIYLAKWEDKAFAFYDSKYSIDESELSISLLLSKLNISQMQIRAVEDLDKNMMPLSSDIEILVGKYTRRVLNEKNQQLVCPSTIAYIIKQFPYFIEKLKDEYSIAVTPLIDGKKETALIAYDNSHELNEDDESEIINHVLNKYDYKTVFVRSVAWLEKIIKNN